MTFKTFITAATNKSYPESFAYVVGPLIQRLEGSALWNEDRLTLFLWEIQDDDVARMDWVRRWPITWLFSRWSVGFIDHNTRLRPKLLDYAETSRYLFAQREIYVWLRLSAMLNDDRMGGDFDATFHWPLVELMVYHLFSRSSDSG